MKKIFLFFMAAALYGGSVFAQNTASTVTFVNTGKMYIGGSSTSYGASSQIALYVPDAVRMLDNNGNVPQIAFANYVSGTNSGGAWRIDGNFYQDSQGNVFTYPYGSGERYGAVFFMGNRGVERYIEPSSTFPTFNRSVSYVAFPAIFIESNDTILVPPRMGIDAAVATTLSGNGRLLLQSYDVDNTNYDASLRVVNTSQQNTAVYTRPDFDFAGGSIIVEKEVGNYRDLVANNTVAGSASPLFGFATPFKNTQQAGYFAGNWVRQPERNANFHTQYVLGNKPSAAGSNTIHRDQYLVNATDIMEPGRAYLIKPRPNGFSYNQLIADGGLGVTGANYLDYDQAKFTFDGKVYTMTPVVERLFADDNLPAYSLNSTTTGTTNWLFGNSYTSAISIPKLVTQISNSTYSFYSVMFYFPAGSTSYLPYTLNGGGIVLQDLTEIPAMSVFMLRLLPQGNQGDFTIGKDLLVHSIIDSGQSDLNPNPAPGRAPGSRLNNQVIFRVTPIENDNIYDLAAIGLRENASLGSDNNDIAKIYMADAAFQLYTLTAPDANNNQSRLSANGVPLTVEQVSMNFKPVPYESRTMVLSVKGVETLSSEDFWIEDLQAETTHHFINGEPYIFTTNPDDAQNRFIVHFKAPKQDNGETGLDNILDSKLSMYAIGKEIFVENLLTSDIGADAAIYDIAGKLIDTFKVTNAPKMSYITKGLVSGTYVVRLNRTNSVSTMKLIIR